MPSQWITRIAPTPSGYLHIGNAWSFVLTWLLARNADGRLHLRIDDLDSDRYRPEYVEDIFRSLRWLGLDWDSGPRTAAEFFAQGGQRSRVDHYAGFLRPLKNDNPSAPLLYACDCSRETARRAAEALGRPGIYPGTCRNRNLTINIGGSSAPTAVRILVPTGTAVFIRDIFGDESMARPDLEMGDFLVWKKDGLPAYQLASVVDDDELGVNLVVRGRDLLRSTGAQLYLAQCLGVNLTQARFFHHGLFLDGAREKISKSVHSAREPCFAREPGSAREPGRFALKVLSDSSGGLSCLLGFFGAKLGLGRMGEPWTLGLPALLEKFSPLSIPRTDFQGDDFLREYPDWNGPFSRPG